MSLLYITTVGIAKALSIYLFIYLLQPSTAILNLAAGKSILNKFKPY